MEEPSLSELEQMAGYLQRRLTALKLEAPAEKVTLSGNIIPAGSVFYCRPSRLKALVKRLGGEENVQIMDNAATRGFCRGKDKPALPWTNEVYPYDIGPSCAGIDSDTARISVATTNNCITPTAWDPVKMFQAGTQRFSFNYYTHCDSVLRVLMIHDRPLEPDYFKKTGTYQLSKLLRLDPPNHYPHAAMTSKVVVQMGTTKGYSETWTEGSADFPVKYEIRPVPSFNDLLSIRDTSFSFSPYNSFKIFPNNACCLVEFLPSYGGRPPENGGFVSCQNTGATPLVPFKIKIFKINSNEVLNSKATPEIRYGGYDRKNPPGSGPPPAWGRTYVVQIKTLHDVAVTFRTPEEDEGAGGNDN